MLEPLGGFKGVGSAAISFAIAYALVSVLHVVVGELAPKSLGYRLHLPDRAGLRPADAVVLPRHQADRPAQLAGNLVLRPFGIPPASEAGHAPHSEDELRQLVRHSRQGRA